MMSLETQVRSENLQHGDEQVDRGIDNDEPLHGLREGRETQREGSSAIHKSSLLVLGCQCGPTITRLRGCATYSDILAG